MELSAVSCYRSFSQASFWKTAVLVLLEWKHRAVLQRGKLMEPKPKHSENPVKMKALQEIIQGGTVKPSRKWVLHHVNRGLIYYSAWVGTSRHPEVTQQSSESSAEAALSPVKFPSIIQFCSGHVSSHPHFTNQTLSYWFENHKKAHSFKAGRK